jgi:hypothetical protein
VSFTKLDSGIVDSSIWSEPLSVRVLWITILAKSDENGFVACSTSGLQRAANISVDEFNKALKILESPDPDSRTPDNEGRRIEKINGGWVIINFMKYRARSEVIREQTRERVKKFREKKKDVTQCNVTDTLPSVSVSDSVSDSVPLSLKKQPSESEIVFNEFRKKYPGSKRGNETEYENFCKKHRDHDSILPLLSIALDNQSTWRLEISGAGMFVPEWKNLQTWINQRCWEMEKPKIEKKVDLRNKSQSPQPSFTLEHPKPF